MTNKTTIKTLVLFLTLLASIVCLAFIAGCSNNESPSSVARKFYTAVEKGDTKTIGQVTTPEAVQMTTLFGEKMKGALSAYGKIKSTTEKIDGDTAVVTVTFDNGETEDLDLIKVDGKWKVTFNK